MRREERVSVQGPVKKQQPEGMSHRGADAKEKVCVPEIGLRFPASFVNFGFPMRDFFLMWVGGWVGRPGLARDPNAPPPPPKGP